MKHRHFAGNGCRAIPLIHMTTSASPTNEILALPEPSDDAFSSAFRTIIGVFNHLGARITRTTPHSVTAEIQPDIFIYAALRTYNPNRGKIHWMPIYANRTHGDEGCYLAANRPIEALAREVRRRVYPAAIVWCKEQRETLHRLKEAELVGEHRRAQLETILGALQDREGEIINGDYSLKLSKYELEHPEHSIRATITVRNWNCFLSVAKLLAEDKRLSK